MNSKHGIEPESGDATSKGRDYAVGYGKPPAATRFQKGQSGNPTGRCRGSKDLSTILDEELEQRVVIRENGKQKTITKRRASMKQIASKAALGDHRALQLLINHLHDRESRAATAEDSAQLSEIDKEIVSGVLERLRSVDKTGGAETDE
jgi:uncharacterized protein DUF5681